MTPTEPASTDPKGAHALVDSIGGGSTASVQHADPGELYRRHRRPLLRTVTRAVDAPPELIEDACQSAWMILLRRPPDGTHAFAWLRVVAIREAYRLSAKERRHSHLEDLDVEHGWQDAMPGATSIDDTIEARRALRVLADLPQRQRDDLALLVAGFSYHEIAAMTNQRTYTNINKHIAKARAQIRRSRDHETAGPDPVVKPLQTRDAT